MAKLELMFPELLADEGGYTDRKEDRGNKNNGATKFGVTLLTWKTQGWDKNKDGVIDKEDIKLLTKDDALFIFKTYWDRWRADEIINQSIAELLVDWVWTSGKWGIIIPQRILKNNFKKEVSVDGAVGPKTIHAVNTVNQVEFFISVKVARIEFMEDIVKNDPKQKVNLKGWLNRVNDFRFKA